MKMGKGSTSLLQIQICGLNRTTGSYTKTGWEIVSKGSSFSLWFLLSGVFTAGNLWSFSDQAKLVSSHRRWGKSLRGTSTSWRIFKYPYTKAVMQQMNTILEENRGINHVDGIGGWMWIQLLIFQTQCSHVLLYRWSNGDGAKKTSCFTAWRECWQHWIGSLQPNFFKKPKEIYCGTFHHRQFQVW